MGAFTIPVGAVQYRQPVMPILSRVKDEPPLGEGRQVIPLFFDWGVDFGATIPPVVQVNLNNISTQQFSAIRTLFVNNMGCDVDVNFMFPDTQFPFRVPANQQAFIPVASSRTDFYIWVTGAISGDQTYVEVFNHYIEPGAFAPTSILQSAATAAVDVTGVSSVAITSTVTNPPLAAGTSGVLSEALIQFGGAVAGAGAGFVTLSIFDAKSGGAQILAEAVVSLGNAQVAGPALLCKLDQPTRFYNGLSFACSFGGTAFASGKAIAMIGWHP